MQDDILLDQQQATVLQHQYPFVMWTVTWNTSDYPRQATARPRIIETGNIAVLRAVILANSLEQLRQQLPIGLTKLERDPDDDPVIVEVWI